MKIGIIGMGAIGMLFGAYLAEAKHDITFYVRTNKKIESVYIEKEAQDPVPISSRQVSDMEGLHTMNLIIVAVKYHHLDHLKNQLDTLPKEIPLLFIQNGLLHLSFVKQLQQENIMIGSVLHGASKTSLSTVRHLGIGVTTIGMYKGSSEIANTFFSSSSDKFPIRFTSNIEETLFKKALLNCLINPLTTIAKVQNGMLVKNESYKAILKNMYEELITVFDEWSERLAWEEVVALCYKTEYNRSSMLTDYENGRLMEIDTIVGAVLLEAQKRKKELPVLHTFYLLLKEMNKVGEQYS